MKIEQKLRVRYMKICERFRESWLISKFMHKILIYLHIIHLLQSSTCFEHYPTNFHEV
jgi:hypothetical protein